MTQPLYAPVYFVGDGSTASYPFPFYVSSASNLRVIQVNTLGIETPLTFGIDFAVVFADGSQGSGSVVLTGGNLTAGFRLAIFNIEELNQDTDIKNQGPYFAIDVEKAFDKLTRIAQQQQIDLLKSMRLPDGLSESDFDTQLPSNLAQSPGSALIVNPQGTGWILGIPSGSSLEGVTDSSTIDLSLASNILTASIIAESIVNGLIAPGAAIARNKLATGSNNRLVQNNGSGVMTDAAAITPERLLISDANGIPVHSDVTAAEAAYLDGVTSLIQDQLDSKLPLAGGTLTNYLTLHADPTNPLHAVTKQYADSIGSGRKPKTAVRVVVTTNGTFATAFDDGSSAGGVTLATNDRIAIVGQTAAEENGIFDVQASGAPIRATDADTWDKLIGAAFLVLEGTAAGTGWICTITAGGTLDTDPVTFVNEFLGPNVTAGNGLQKTLNEVSVKHDGSTLSSSASGLKVAAGGITNTELFGGILMEKLEALTPNRAIITGSTGELEESDVTNVELSYLDGVTSAIQAQLDARIAASLLTTNGDIIQRVAGVPARLGIGANGKVLTVAGGLASWEDSQAAGQNISETYFRGSTSAGSESITMNAWTPFTLADPAVTGGTGMTRSGNNAIPAFTGKYEVRLVICRMNSNGQSPEIAFRIRNMTTGVTVEQFKPNFPSGVFESGKPVIVFGEFPVTNVSHQFQFQYIAVAGGGSPSGSFVNSSISGEVPPRWEIYVRRISS